MLKGSRRDVRQKMKINELYAVSADRELTTTELFSSNDFYGHATLLKRWLSIAPEYSLKVVLAHSPAMRDFVWDVEVNSGMPFCLCTGAYRASIFNNVSRPRGGPMAVPIGPLIAYHPGLKALWNYKPETKTLLIFPSHSTHHIHVHFDERQHIRLFKPYTRDFSRVVVCLYWKDVLLGRAEAYQAEGFECATAGHMYDFEFVPRILNIISDSSMVISSSPGTSVLYSSFLRRPTLYLDQKIEGETFSSQVFQKERERMLRLPGLKDRMKHIFSELVDSITTEQDNFLRVALGTEYIRSPGEIIDLLKAAEYKYSKNKKIEFHDIPLVH